MWMKTRTILILAVQANFLLFAFRYTLRQRSEIVEVLHGIQSHTPSTDCALLFFGLPRHFRDLALPTYKKFLPIDTCDVYVHAFNDTHVINRRNFENHALNASELLELKTKAIMFEDSAVMMKKYNIEREFAPYNNFNTIESTYNIVKQWYSLEQVWRLMERSTTVPYKKIALLRVDVMFVSPLTKGMLELPAAAPEPYDRAFVGNFTNAKIWATERFSHILSYLAKHHKLHSETFVRSVLFPAISNISQLQLCFMRIRGDGAVIFTDGCYGDEFQNREWPWRSQIIKNATGFDCQKLDILRAKCSTPTTDAMQSSNRTQNIEI